MQSCIKVKNSRPAGDSIALMAAMKKLYEDTGSKIVWMQRLNMKGIGYKGAIHPFEDEQGDSVAMNEYMFNMLKPLFLSQEYIEDCIIYDGQEFDYDLDKGMMETYTNQPLGSLNRWIFYVYPQMSCDLSKSWINLPKLINND